uniref:NADH-ubiquinone oxidoreductase chain 2 n=1 Tax=Megaderma spasma TaxID=9414 RepID=NU2M_MEGSP|nr:RecName: Full=NADH-ubiquinone oxidoreductase chain 2; AltName: Full=NADH dehydrogenase subunit 2 [Megaderma spasma]AAS91408.1 NADH dehydrogenase subunit 2 [Megaderma spasma]
MNPLASIMITLTIILGTMIVMTSSHWLLVWIGFEMNMLAIIPVLMKQHSPRAVEAATKYFLTQATASMLLMLAVVTNLLYSGQWTVTNITNPLASAVMTLALVMKLGLSPFHFWVPEVAQGIPLSSGLVLLTWQKLAPLSVLYQISHSVSPTLLLTVSLMSIAVGGWGGLNQTQLRKILAYSSIAHMGWMTAVLAYNPTLTLLNLTLYILMTTTTFLLFMFNSSTTTLTLSHSWNKSPMIATSTLTIMLSLGGLPPLTGFLPKWMIIQELTKNESLLLPTLMAMMALLSLYFYMRLTYSTSLTLFPSMNNTKMKWHLNNTKKVPLLPPMITLFTLALPLAPALSTLY